MKLDDFSKNTIIKLYKNPYSGSWLIARGQMYSDSWLIARGQMYSGSWLIARGQMYSGSRLIARGQMYSGSRLIARGQMYSGSWLIARGQMYSGSWLIARGQMYSDSRLIPCGQMYRRMDRRTILRTRLTNVYPCWALNSFPPSTTRRLVTLLTAIWPVSLLQCMSNFVKCLNMSTYVKMQLIKVPCLLTDIFVYTSCN